jgi:hypothetical protein
MIYFLLFFLLIFHTYWSENWVLWKIFGPKREEMAGGWRRLHSEELHNLYASPNIIKVTKSRTMGRACSTHGRDEKYIQDFGQKT